MKPNTQATHTLTDLRKGKVYKVRIIRTLEDGSMIVETVGEAQGECQYNVKPGSSFLQSIRNEAQS